MALVLNERELGRRLGRKAFLGIQQKGGINHDVFGRHRGRSQSSGRKLKHWRIVRASLVNNGSPLAVHPIGVVVVVILLNTITALRDPDNASHQVVKRKFCVRRTLLAFPGNPLNLLDQKTLVGTRNLGSLALRQIDVVGLNLRVRKPVGQGCVRGSSIQLRRTQEKAHGIVDGVCLDASLRPSIRVLDIQNRKELLDRTQTKLDLDLSVLERNHGQRRSNVFAEPEVKRHDNLATPNRRLRLNIRIKDLNRMRILEHASLRVAWIVEFGNIADHLIDQGTLIGIVGHLRLQLEPLAIGIVHCDSIDLHGGPLDRVVPNVLNPLKLKSRVVKMRGTIRILQRRPDVRKVEDKIAIMKKIRDTAHLTTERGRGSGQRKLKT